MQAVRSEEMFIPTEVRDAPNVGILIIHSYTAYCSTCGHEASPSERKHHSIMGQAAYDNPELRNAGCGVKFVATASPHQGEHARRGAKNLRPDLPFIAIHTER
jgi:hypothetical protein